MEKLTEGRRARLVEIVVGELRDAGLPAPAVGEGEAKYTNRCLAPLLERVISEIGFPGLVPLRSQGAAMISCHYLGVNFYPDLGVRFYESFAMAIEVKFLRGAQRQNSIATAIGQGVVYSSRFGNSAVMLIDTSGRATPNEVASASVHLSSFGIPLIFRSANRSGDLRPHPSDRGS